VKNIGQEPSFENISWISSIESDNSRSQHGYQMYKPTNTAHKNYQHCERWVDKKNGGEIGPDEIGPYKIGPSNRTY
jgi:hypothetical protein